MDESSAKKRTLSPFWELFFNMTYLSPISNFAYLLLWTLEKLLLLCPAMLSIYHDTPWSVVSDFFRAFNVLGYFPGQTAFVTFVFVLFGAVQLCIGLGVYQFWTAMTMLKKGKMFASRYSYRYQALHLFLVACSKVLLPISALLLGFTIRAVSGIDQPLEEYKNVSRDLLDPGTSVKYATLAVTLLMFVETVAVAVMDAVFCQDRSVLNKTLWSDDSWIHSGLWALLHIVVQFDFVFADQTASSVKYLGLAVFWVAQIVAVVWLTRWAHYWYDMAEFAFRTFAAMSYALVIVSGTTGGVVSLGEYYPYVVAFPVHSFLLCLIRTYVVWGVNMAPPKKEEDAVEAAHVLFRLMRSKDYRSTVMLAGYINVFFGENEHDAKSCTELLKEIKRSPAENVAENYTVYPTDKDLPEAYSKGPTLRLVKLFLNFLQSSHGKGQHFTILMAESAFYYFANHYTALELTSQLSSQKPGLVISQRIYNLRRMLQSGMYQLAENEHDSDQTLHAITYLRHYHKFLSQMDSSTEKTIRFWSILLEDTPSAQALNRIGQSLFASKYRIIKTAEKLSRITSNHIEFLIRYGLFMKFVMHDLMSADQAFHKLVALHDSASPSMVSSGGFSLFRTDVPVMLVLGSIEASGECVIREVNTEAENSLGFPRKDLIGYSATRIMPPMVETKHPEFVKEFFKTMKAQCVDQPKVRFVKTADGHYVACRTVKRLVPKLDGGEMQIALFMIMDNKVTPYTCYRTAPCCKKTGAILCNHGYGVVGFSKEAVRVLGLSEEDVLYLAKNTTLYDLFPALQKREVLMGVLEKEGRVIAYSQTGVLFDHLADPLVDNTELTLIPRKDATSPKQVLLWARLIVDSYGGVEKAFTLLVSEIPPDRVHEYQLIENSGGIYANQPSAPRVEEMKHPVKEIPMITEAAPAEKMQEFSPAPSVASMASFHSVKSGTNTTGFNEMVQEFQIQNMSRKTPASIKKLLAGIISMLIVTGVLIGVSAYVFLQEKNSLAQRFRLVKEYEARYKMTVTITGMIYSYEPIASFQFPFLDWFTGIFIVRAGMVTEGNEKTRKLLFEQGLGYDEEFLTIPDPYEGFRTVTFSHSLLIFVNTIIEFSQYKYELMNKCFRGLSPPSYCAYVRSKVRYAFDLLFYYMRFKQDEVSDKLEAELKNMATRGETTQYAIMIACIGLVVLSTAAIIPIFNWVIKGKSSVLSIFADIERSEARKVIEECQRLDIKNLRYKRKWIALSGGNQHVLWNKIIDEQNKGFGGAEKSSKMVAVRDHKVEVGESSSFTTVARKVVEKADKTNPNREEDANVESEAPMVNKEEVEQKRTKRKELLSEIEFCFFAALFGGKNERAGEETNQQHSFKLRQGSILRLVGVLALFLSYGGASIYFNYYVHHTNNEAVSMFFAINKRNIYHSLITIYLQEAVATGNKVLIGQNRGNDGKQYMTDIINQMLAIEAKTVEFSKSASDRIYGSYLSLSKRAEGPEFCNISDLYNYTQIYPCEVNYIGPKGRGLSEAIQYMINFHIAFANRVDQTNYSDPAAALMLRFDPSPSILVGMVDSYVSSVTEQLMFAFYDDSMGFFRLIETAVYAMAVCFVTVFTGFYLFIFIRFIGVLNNEIWQTQGLVGMIPMFILRDNAKVRESVCQHKGIK